ncbi:S53 family peptidase [Nevskia soli]|uniref:S53 family peptidase n=1 Tax=Nevskia soli TaxID=418856 RepID=UPI0015D8AEA9|nr:S53 family peptidase [Nevskia soli]
MGRFPLDGYFVTVWEAEEGKLIIENRETLQKMGRSGGFMPLRRSLTCFGLIATAVLPISAATGQRVPNTTPPYVATAKNLGPADPTATIDVSIWLNIHNRSQLDALAAQLYNPSSPNYRHWLKPADLIAQFAPSADEAATVRQFFTSHNLSIVTVGPGNLFVRAQGTVGAVEKAFQVQLNNYSVRGATYRAPASDPYVEGAAAGLVRAVAGLDNGGYVHPLVARPSSPPGAPPAPAAPAGANSADFFVSNCFTGVETQTYTSDGDYPKVVYKGNGYAGTYANPNPGCGYTPPEIYTAYNLTGLYNEGYNGAGQSIAIIDWCGSPTIQSDANGFSTMFGLPQLNSSNFTITDVPTVSSCAAPDPEINIDVEWAHAIAPGANIDLVVPPSASFEDVDEAESYIVIYGLGTVISGSYGSIESETPTSTLQSENLINEMAAVAGIAANFASSDEGDFSVEGVAPSVSAPADGTYATAVGGVSVALDSANNISWQVGWGSNFTLAVSEGEVFNPPLAFGFEYGSGGGPSAVFPQPSFQAGLPGTTRQLPDISWVGDPYTGVAILISEPFSYPVQVWQVYGGTSVATPMFSGLWAIANEEAGVALGQAATYVYTMPAGTITDVVPAGGPGNVRAVIATSSGSNTGYTASAVMGGATPSKFYSAIWDYPDYQDTVYIISFGTDCTAVTDGYGTLCTAPGALQTATGWDNVTGVGTPNGQAFADSFRP